MDKKISIFVPGRLCLFGEHSDWAGVNRIMNPEIAPGCAIVTGVEQGIYATAYKSDKFIVRSSLEDGSQIVLENDMNLGELRDIAREGQFFSYVAGVASYMCEWYKVGGMTLEITKMNLPMKSGLSSSAAICVLVARAFNILYDLHLNTLGIMNIAYWGELRTPSKCGRLDQACAFGVNPVAMTFDGNEVDVESIQVKSPLHYVFADLMAGKDTVKILNDLSVAYPYPGNEKEKREVEALGEDNIDITNRAKKYISEGKVKELGLLMTEAQQLFDEKIAPLCPEELTAPVLHKILADENVKALTYGAKGVGSQGDGTVQFLAKDEKSQVQLIDYLTKEKGMVAYPLTLNPMNATDTVQITTEEAPKTNTDGNIKKKISKAIIPVAGFGTRLYPQTRGVKKEFCPVVDFDGLVKPGIMVLLEELDRAGIEDICIILNREEKKYYEEFFFKELQDKHLAKLNSDALKYEDKLKRIAKKISFAFQDEQKGFGHAVYQARDFANNEPTLLLLGDTIYHSNTELLCTQQLMQAYENVEAAIVALQPVQVEAVSHYGIFAGEWQDKNDSLMKLSKICEKPSPEMAKENLLMRSQKDEEGCFAAFGAYILTRDVFERLDEAIAKNIVNGKGEIELTDALAYVSERKGMFGLVIDGESYDLGNPEAYRHTVANFGINKR